MRRIYDDSDMKKVVSIPSTNSIGYNNYENREQRRKQERENKRKGQYDSFAQIYRNTYANNYANTYNNKVIRYTSNDPKINYCMEYCRTRNSKLYEQLNPTQNTRTTNNLNSGDTELER